MDANFRGATPPLLRQTANSRHQMSKEAKGAEIQALMLYEHCLGSADPAYLQRSIRQAIERAKAFPTFGSKGPTQSMLFPNQLQRTLLSEDRLIAAAIPAGHRPHDGLRATCFCLCSFLIGHLDWGMEPVRLDDQEVAGQVLKDSFSRCADENPLPAISRHGAHHDNVSVKFIRYER